MQLRALLVKLRDQSLKSTADCPWVDPIIVIEVLDWELGKEVISAAEIVLVQRALIDLVPTKIRKGEGRLAVLDLQRQMLRCTTILGKNVAQVRSPVFLRHFFADLAEP